MFKTTFLTLGSISVLGISSFTIISCSNNEATNKTFVNHYVKDSFLLSKVSLKNKKILILDEYIKFYNKDQNWNLLRTVFVPTLEMEDNWLAPIFATQFILDIDITATEDNNVKFLIKAFDVNNFEPFNLEYKVNYKNGDLIKPSNMISAEFNSNFFEDLKNKNNLKNPQEFIDFSKKQENQNQIQSLITTKNNNVVADDLIKSIEIFKSPIDSKKNIRIKINYNNPEKLIILNKIFEIDFESNKKASFVEKEVPVFYNKKTFLDFKNNLTMDEFVNKFNSLDKESLTKLSFFNTTFEGISLFMIPQIKSHDDEYITFTLSNILYPGYNLKKEEFKIDFETGFEI